MSIASKMYKILDTKTNIKQAIIDKGVDVDDTTPFDNYPDKIAEISGGIDDIQWVNLKGIGYIDTGIKLKNTSKIEFSFILNTNTQQMRLYNAPHSTIINSLYMNSNFQFAIISATAYPATNTNYMAYVGTRYTIISDYKNATITINGTTKSFSRYGGTWESSENLLLGAYAGTDTSMATKMSLYYFKIYDNDELIGDYTPGFVNQKLGFINSIDNSFLEIKGIGGNLVYNNYIDIALES